VSSVRAATSWPTCCLCNPMIWFAGAEVEASYAAIGQWGMLDKSSPRLRHERMGPITRCASAEIAVVRVVSLLPDLARSRLATMAPNNTRLPKCTSWPRRSARRASP